jgi:hypothetical protein
VLKTAKAGADPQLAMQIAVVVIAVAMTVEVIVGATVEAIVVATVKRERACL